MCTATSTRSTYNGSLSDINVLERSLPPLCKGLGRVNVRDQRVNTVCWCRLGLNTCPPTPHSEQAPRVTYGGTKVAETSVLEREPSMYVGRGTTADLSVVSLSLYKCTSKRDVRE